MSLPVNCQFGRNFGGIASAPYACSLSIQNSPIAKIKSIETFCVVDRSFRIHHELRSGTKFAPFEFTIVSATGLRRNVSGVSEGVSMDGQGRWDPLRLLGEEMGRMFEHLGMSSLHSARPFPTLNVYERGHRYLILAEIPGTDPESIDLCVSGDTVTIRGERRRVDRVVDETFRRQERPFGHWERRITLPEEVISQEVTADLDNGVLRIDLPKAAPARSQNIPVTVRSKRARESEPRALEGPSLSTELSRPALPVQKPSSVRRNVDVPKE
jgi:HSP20 family protein